MHRRQWAGIVLLVLAAAWLMGAWFQVEPYMDEDWLPISMVTRVFLPGAILAGLGIWLLRRD